MQLRFLRTFVDAAETLNFSKTAERVHLTQSSVTEQIQTLEVETGAKLFDRSNRRLALTQAGETLLSYAIQLLATAREAQRQIDAVNSAPTRLTLGGLETLCASFIPALVASALEAEPARQFAIRSANSAALRRMIETGEIDFALYFGAIDWPKGIASEVIGTDELVVGVPPSHRLANAESVGAEDLAGERMVATSRGCIFRRRFDEAFADTDQPLLVAECDSIATISGLAASLSAAVLAPRMALVEQRPNLRLIPWLGEPRTMDIAIAWRAPAERLVKSILPHAKIQAAAQTSR